jgi:NAD(P)-dependent dehydrogenase (short-subunit alcohol dehydrogenase family)
MRLAGKVAIVAGAAWGGIGAATAYRFAQEGAKVVVNTYSREDKLAETVERIEAIGGEAAMVMGDVADVNAWEAMVQTALSRFGKITTLVQNASQSTIKPALDISQEEWNRGLAVALGGPWLGQNCVCRR